MKLVYFTLGLASAFELEWAQWKVEHGRYYNTRKEHDRRQAIFAKNLAFVNKHNAEGHSYTVGLNKFADLENEEFLAHYAMPETNQAQIRLNYKCPEKFRATLTSTPDEIDHVANGYVTAVKDQGQCGSCWSFGTTGAYEGAYCQANGQDCRNWSGASEQELCDCDGSSSNEAPYYDMGCNGGWIDNGLYYIINEQINSESDYPYTSGNGRTGSCKKDAGKDLSGLKTCGATAEGDEDDLKNALAEVGPVGVAINASGLGFQLYTGGVYDNPSCSNSLNHAVLSVGYGNMDRQDYFKVKNSWGTGWGDAGFIYMSRNKSNQCGIASVPAYAAPSHIQ